MDDFGISFSPQQPAGATGAKAGTPVQEAIRVLALRMPKAQAPQAIAPQGLLTAPGAAPLMGQGGMGLEQIIQRLLGLMGKTGPLGQPAGPPMGGGSPAPRPAPMAMPSQAMAPRITPGFGGMGGGMPDVNNPADFNPGIATPDRRG